MKLAVDLIFDFNQDFYHASALYAGLSALAQRGAIRLRFRGPKGIARELTKDPLTVCLRLHGADLPGPLLLAIDLHDQSDVFGIQALRQCDFYLKRSFYRPDVAALPAEWSQKISPFGLNYACRTRRSTMRLFRAAACPLGLCKHSSMRRLAHHLTLPQLGAFEQQASTPIEPTIVFQTRVWEPWGSTPAELETSQAINEGRVTIVRALKAAFGHRFRGGLVPTPLAQRRYPHEVSPFASRQGQYAAMSKKNLIGIYTRGLFDSTAFKLPEYLAASQCVVAERMRNEAPVPLVAGMNYLAFENADECVAACRRLLADQELAAVMRHANQAYYQAEVEPSAHLGRVLDRCLDMSRRGLGCDVEPALPPDCGQAETVSAAVEYPSSVFPILAIDSISPPPSFVAN